MRIRTVECVDERGNKFSVEHCTKKSPMPSRRQACFGGPCPARWLPEPWSEVGKLWDTFIITSWCRNLWSEAVQAVARISVNCNTICMKKRFIVDYNGKFPVNPRLLFIVVLRDMRSGETAEEYFMWGSLEDEARQGRLSCEEQTSGHKDL